MTPSIDDYRAMRERIINKYTDRIDTFHELLVQRCDEAMLLANARRIFAIGGAALPSYVGKAELVRWVIFGAQRLFVHSVEQRLWFIGDLNEETARTEEAAILAYESWESLFQSWCEG